MDRIIKIVGWVVVAVLGLVVWTFFPEAQTIIACLLAATLIFYVFFAAVKVTVGQMVGDKLMELRLEINSVDKRLELMDRKTNALLRNALERAKDKPKGCNWSSTKATACCATTICLTSQVAALRFAIERGFARSPTFPASANRASRRKWTATVRAAVGSLCRGLPRGGCGRRDAVGLCKEPKASCDGAGDGAVVHVDEREV